MSKDSKKVQDYRDMPVDSLQKELAQLQKEQFENRMKLTLGESSATHQLKQARKNIARCKTILNEKQRTAATAE